MENPSQVFVPCFAYAIYLFQKCSCAGFTITVLPLAGLFNRLLIDPCWSVGYAPAGFGFHASYSDAF